LELREVVRGQLTQGRAAAGVGRKHLFLRR